MKTYICTLGTSIANRLGRVRNADGQEVNVLSDAQRRNASWGSVDNESVSFRQQLDRWVETLLRGNAGVDVEDASAELTILSKMHVSPDDRVVLMATDTFLGECCVSAVKRCIIAKFGLEESTVLADRVVGLQVNNREMLQQQGFGNFLDCVRKRIDEAKRQGEDVALCPNGGFKGVVPFLTILGMLNGCRVVYTFEHAGCVIDIPPLPFTLSGEYFRRAASALGTLTERVEMPESEYLGLIEDYAPEERDLFLGFVQRCKNGMVTPMSLLEHLIDAAETPYAMLSNAAVEKMRSMEGRDEYVRFADLIMRAQNPEARNALRHSLNATDMMAIKAGRTNERLIGFEVGNLFYVALVMNHAEYDTRVTGGNAPQKANFPVREFHRWEPAGVCGRRQWSMFETLSEKVANANNRMRSLEMDVENANRINDQLRNQLGTLQDAFAKAQEECEKKGSQISQLHERIAEFNNGKITLLQALKQWWRRSR